MLSFRQYIREVDLSFFRDHPKLGELESKLKTKLASDEEEVLNQYKKSSFVLNNPLIQYHNNGITPPNNISTHYVIYNLPVLDSATNKPFNRSFTMYSGLGFDPRTQMNKDKRVLMPAFTSGSLNKGTAGGFMQYKDENGFQHILRVNVKHNDHGVSMSPITTSEHEIILPRNIILHIHRSEIDPENPKVIVHHATIDHESDPHDFQKPIKSHLVNDLMNKIQSKTHTNEDIDQASIQGYLTQDHIDELSKQLSQNIKTKSYTSDDLENAIKYGYIKNIGQKAINAIANDPESTWAHYFLAQAHEKGKDIGQAAINAIANQPYSTQVHYMLAQAHRNGKYIGQTAINAIANHPDSTDAHNWLAEAHHDGRSIGQAAINAIAKHPKSIQAQSTLAQAHYYGENIGQAAINAISNNPNSTDAHAILSQLHREGKKINQAAIKAIANNPESKDAHTKLAEAYYTGRYIGQDAIDAIINNPESTRAHSYLICAHENGRSIGEANYNKILSYRNQDVKL